MILPKSEIKELCLLIQAYCRDEISTAEYWQMRDEHFKQIELPLGIERGKE